MRAAYEKYSAQGFEVLSVSVGERDTEVLDFIEKYGLSYPFLLDRTGQISNVYEISSTPTTYFIAPDGTITDALAGVVTEDWLKANLSGYIVT